MANQMGCNKIYFFDLRVQNKKYGNFDSISRLTGACGAQKLTKNAVLVYGHVYITWSY